MSFKPFWKAWSAGIAILFLILPVAGLSQQAGRGINVAVYESPT